MTAVEDGPHDLVVQGMTKTFGTKVLWTDLSFTLPGGTMTAVRGPSGSGKTTMLNCIGLLEPFDAGTIRLGGRALAPATRSSARARHRDLLGYLFQNYGLVESWDVRRNLLVPLRNRPVPRSEWARVIEAALARVGMRGAERERIYTLSGGEQQRIALARLILKAPSLVLADEPTSALDSGNADLVMTILAELAESGALVVVSTHNDTVAQRCDGTLWLGEGVEPRVRV